MPAPDPPRPPPRTFRLQTISEIAARRAELIALLVDGVDGGASIGFLPPLAASEAGRYWDGVASDLATGSRALIVALVEDHVAGAVQLALCMKANGRHRADVEKLLVHTAHRSAGLGRALLTAVEAHARTQHRSLLVLDTRTGDVASALYRSCGYIEVGQIPGYVVNGAGELEATTYFYKQL